MFLVLANSTMTIKKQTPLLASSFSVAENVRIIHTLLLEEGASRNILESTLEFARRNILAEKECCSRCLKAFILEKIKEKNSKELILVVNRVLRDEIGHEGYYLDGEELRKI